MILHPFARRFNIMKDNGNHIQYVLDIGAYRGDFTETVKSIWPTAIVRQIEADERQQRWLQDNAIISLLGDKESVSVDFYTLAQDKITTGSSLYKEMTRHYTESTTLILKKPMTTIDALDKIYKFYGNWRELGLVKIDTQGSELLILDGAKEFLLKNAPKYILLECSVIQYNDGAPLIAEVIAYMNSINYRIKDVFDLSYNEKNILQQTDMLFERL